MRRHEALEASGYFLGTTAHAGGVVVGLQAQPVGGGAAEDELEPERQVGRDGAVAAGDAMQLRAADAEGLRRPGVGEALGFDVPFEGEAGVGRD